MAREDSDGEGLNHEDLAAFLASVDDLPDEAQQTQEALVEDEASRQRQAASAVTCEDGDVAAPDGSKVARRFGSSGGTTQWLHRWSPALWMRSY